MNKSEFIAFIEQKKTAVSDGATGTNLMQAGLPSGLTSEHWVLENPDALFSLHRSFIESGVDIITTSTFGGSRVRLDQSSLSAHFEEINRKAVEIARRAAEGTDVLVAASMGPLGHMLKPNGLLEVDEAEEHYRAQAAILADSGANLIVIETQFDIQEASAAVRGASAATDIALVCFFSYDRGARTMMGVKPQDTAEAMNNSGICALGINCGKSLGDNFNVLRELAQATDLPIWFKPNAGLPKVSVAGATEYDIDPQAMATGVSDWMAAGARVIGGCCGTTPAHLKSIADQVHAHSAN
jgi:5-methyltetrahydrofolate--homocysteine methyltransferase